MEYRIEAINKKELDESFAKFASKEDLKDFVTKADLIENNRILLTQFGQSIRTIVREEIEKARDEKLDDLVERKVEEKLKGAHITLS